MRIEGKRRTPTTKNVDNSLRDLLLLHLKCLNIDNPDLEVRVVPYRRWRFDLAWTHLRVAVEIDGGTWTKGRHTRGAGFQSDCQKINAGNLAGWATYRFTGEMVKTGEAAETIRLALQYARKKTEIIETLEDRKKVALERH